MIAGLIAVVVTITLFRAFLIDHGDALCGRRRRK